MLPKSILVVDDEPAIRRSLSEILIREGYSVVTAHDGIGAVEKFRTGSYGLIILDLKMPGIDGMEVLKQVKETHPDTQVVIITGDGTVPGAVEAMKMGAFDYVLKPFSMEVMESIVMRVFSNNTDGTEQSDPKEDLDPKTIVTRDPQMLKIMELAGNIASSKATVLIQGESGTGKELLAHFIHKRSDRRDEPFIAVNCAALPEALLESELFGHEKGAFTGAVGKRIGKFELAHHGTLLLDEISQMDLQLQAKLLRALQENEVDRVGGKRPVPIDIRVLVTTNIELKKAVSENTFREDLYYRLNVIPITISPLRERRGDLPLLVNHFLRKHNLRNGRNVSGISEDAMSRIIVNEWKGNIRELENTIERAVLLCMEDTILPEHLFLDESEPPEGTETGIKAGLTMKEMEKNLILETLKQAGGNRTHAARTLEISIRTLRNKLREYESLGVAVPSH